MTSRSAEKKWTRGVIKYKTYLQGLVAVCVGVVTIRLCHHIVGDNMSYAAVFISSIGYILVVVAILFFTKNEYVIWLYEYVVHKVKREGENG